MLLAKSKHVFRYRNVQLCDEFEKYQNYAGVFVLEFNYNSKGDVRLCIDDQESIYARLTEWKEGVTKDGQSFLAAEFLYREKGRVFIFSFNEFESVKISLNKGAYMLFF